MSTTDESTQETEDGGGPPPSQRPAWMTALMRYGPIVVVVLVVAAAVIVIGGRGGDDKSDDTASSGDAASQDELIRSGPMTPQKAELENKTVDFGPNCDTDTGKIKLVSVYAPPCVEPFSGDNGGATSSGVTADAVKIVLYQADPKLDPLTAATVANAGADVNPESATQTVQGFVDLYNKLYETYGRKVDVEIYTGTGAGDDVEAAKADAIAIADKHPFAVIGGPAQEGAVFRQELAARKVTCGPGWRPRLNRDNPSPHRA